ncbi:MAG TPA: hypothetical protein DCQ53_13900, partial [Alphaproteobacteria bacterium]|nr:hypothetical protein [Alphaproteobacteria bacterium]
DIQLGGNVDFQLADWVDGERQKGSEPTEDEIKAQRSQIAAEIATKKKQALDAGGLYVMGSERHESRR